MTIRVKYYWKELTSDGLLKEPKEAGPYYSTTNLNGYGGFDTEEEAVERLTYVKSIYIGGTLVGIIFWLRFMDKRIL